MSSFVLHLAKHSEQYKRPDAMFPPQLRAEMLSYHWPGNVRELENYMKRIVVVRDLEGVRKEIQNSGGAGPWQMSVRELPDDPMEYEGKTLRDVSRKASQKAERKVLEQILEKTRWNRKRAASMLDISYKALLYKIRQTGLE